jgi:transcriptional regulator with XRE-family HTH domain
MMNLGDKIKLLRQEAGYTQEELAKKMGLAKSTIAHYESGRREPDTKTIIKIANLFNISTDNILDNVRFKNEPKIVLYGADGKLVDISMLSKEDQEYVLSLAERLKNKR